MSPSFFVIDTPTGHGLVGVMDELDGLVRRLARGIGAGTIAGVIGTAAMTVSSTVEARLRGRQPSTAPAKAAERVLGINGFASPAAENRFSTLVHWGYGTGWGVARGLLDAAGLGNAAIDVFHHLVYALAAGATYTLLTNHARSAG